MALKHRVNLRNVDTFITGGTEIPKGTYVTLSSSVLVAAGAGVKGLGFTTEIGYANQPCQVARPGSDCLALAHDADISEMDDLICSSTGRADTIATLYSASQVLIAMSLQDSSAAGQLIVVRVIDPCPVAKAAS